MISVLRDRNIPARYAKGEIEITAEQAMEWTATDDINVAMRVISALGIPTTGMVSNGETVAVRLEHVWVKLMYLILIIVELVIVRVSVCGFHLMLI